MSIFLLRFLGATAGIASMTAALERGDLDEAARQGVQAGPAVVAQALRSPNRSTVLAGIVAAPAVEDRAELLVPLAKVAGGSDRRTAIPAARAAAAIAERMTRKDLPDDLAADDIQTWRATYETLAITRGRAIEARVAALETAASLEHVIDRDALGFDLGKALADPDPLLRVAALGLVPRPTAIALRASIVAVLGDSSDRVALAAAQTLCADADTTALGVDDIAKVKALVKAHPGATEARDASRCLK